MGENCSASCGTRDHASWGECVRSKGLRVAYCNSAAGRDYTVQKRWDRELTEYKDARAQGIQPAGTTRTKVRAAVEASNRVGKAYDAGSNTFGAGV